MVDVAPLLTHHIPAFEEFEEVAVTIIGELIMLTVPDPGVTPCMPLAVTAAVIVTGELMRDNVPPPLGVYAPKAPPVLVDEIVRGDDVKVVVPEPLHCMPVVVPLAVPVETVRGDSLSLVLAEPVVYKKYDVLELVVAVMVVGDELRVRLLLPCE